MHGKFLLKELWIYAERAHLQALLKTSMQLMFSREAYCKIIRFLNKPKNDCLMNFWLVSSCADCLLWLSTEGQAQSMQDMLSRKQILKKIYRGGRLFHKCTFILKSLFTFASNRTS